MSGGGARSQHWQQLVADIFGIEVVRMGIDEGPAYGAAILAAVGGGLHSSVEEVCDKFIRVADLKSPDFDRSRIYHRFYSSLYRPLYNTLKDFFYRDAAFVKDISKQA